MNLYCYLKIKYMFNLQCFVTKVHLYSDKMELHETNTKQVNSHFNHFLPRVGPPWTHNYHRPTTKCSICPLSDSFALNCQFVSLTWDKTNNHQIMTISIPTGHWVMPLVFKQCTGHKFWNRIAFQLLELTNSSNSWNTIFLLVQWGMYTLFKKNLTWFIKTWPNSFVLG